MSEEKNNRIRIKDIAKIAGVSTGTVDRVLHGRGKVSLANEQKVQEAIESLNYKPNMMARSLAMKKTFEIAILLPYFGKDSFWKSQLRGINNAYKNIKDFGFNLTILEFNDQIHGDLLKHKDTLINGKIDAILLAPTIADDAHLLLDHCIDQEIPYLLVNTNLSRGDEYFLGYVGQDSFQSGKLCAQLLVLTSGSDCTLGVFHMEKEIEYSEHMLQKEKGFKKYIDTQSGVKINTITKNLGTNKDKTKLKREVSNFLSEYPNTKGICVTTSRIHYLVSVLKKLKRTDITLVGFDLIKENVKALSEYEKLILINQDPERQGHVGLTSLFGYLLEKKSVSLKRYLPLGIVTSENVSAYMDTDNRKMD